MARQGLVTGFRLWGGESGVPIGLSQISYEATNSIVRAFAVGLLNTLLVAIVGIVFATILGFIIGLARLSPNWLISRLAYWYVEFIRNTPLLLILVFLYSFKQLLPEIGEVEANAWGFYATVKGFYVPRPLFTEGLGWVSYLPLVGIAATFALRTLGKCAPGKNRPELSRPVGRARADRSDTGAWSMLRSAARSASRVANKTRFNLTGGLELQPEFIAVLAGLVLYTASFIAENVRVGRDGHFARPVGGGFGAWPCNAGRR